MTFKFTDCLNFTNPDSYVTYFPMLGPIRATRIYCGLSDWLMSLEIVIMYWNWNKIRNFQNIQLFSYNVIELFFLKMIDENVYGIYYLFIGGNNQPNPEWYFYFFFIFPSFVFFLFVFPNQKQQWKRPAPLPRQNQAGNSFLVTTPPSSKKV